MGGGFRVWGFEIEGKRVFAVKYVFDAQHHRGVESARWQGISGGLEVRGVEVRGRGYALPSMCLPRAAVQPPQRAASETEPAGREAQSEGERMCTAEQCV